MIDEFYARALAVKSEVDQLCAEAHRHTDDPERLASISQEMDHHVEEFRQIRREQLAERVERARARRLHSGSWWNRLRRRFAA